MSFMVMLFVLLSIGYLGVHIWDHWEMRQSRKLISDDGRFFLKRYFVPSLLLYAEQEGVVSTDAKFAVQQVKLAYRCEVCHQADLFDTGTGVCQRCNHHTL